MGFEQLAAAMLLCGIKDTRKGDTQAAVWLEKEGLDYFEFSTGETCDLDCWKEWVKSGCRVGNELKPSRRLYNGKSTKRRKKSLWKN